jgi:hypothetical protein
VLKQKKLLVKNIKKTQKRFLLSEVTAGLLGKQRYVCNDRPTVGRDRYRLRRDCIQRKNFPWLKHGR